MTDRASASTPRNAALEVFLASLVLLFLELACIRWFPAHVLYLTFFTNLVLLASFLGMSLGLLRARTGRDLLPLSAAVLGVALAAAHGFDYARDALVGLVGVGAGSSAREEVFFGTEYGDLGAAPFHLPVEVIGGLFFVLLTLAFVGPGQALGRALNRIPGRIQGYMWNVLGSMAGIALFALSSRLELPPLAWFAVATLGLLWLALPGRCTRGRMALAAVLLADLGLASIASVSARLHPVDRLVKRETYWSPYYRIDYEPPHRRGIWVNLLGHQRMFAHDDRRGIAYALPYLMRRDAGGAPFRHVLVIGAGSGNDVSRALAFGAESVDAVEIDPVIRRLGERDHPDRPYDDPRVTVHLDDGRNFLRSTTRTFDLVVYAHVDSLVLHSGYANLRLESFLFTREAFADVKRHLAPGGVFVVSNYFRRGWLVARLGATLEEVFGSEPLSFTLPYAETVEPEEPLALGMVLAGDVGGMRAAFATGRPYWLRTDHPALPTSPSGFELAPPGPQPPPRAGEAPLWVRVGPARVTRPADLGVATDDWPFFYIRRPMVPELSLRFGLVMAALALALGALLRPPPRDEAIAPRGTRLRMFLLGAGFMLLEAKAVVHMAVLFGSTWTVNAIVFFAVLLTILAANALVLRYPPRRPRLAYLPLLAALGLNALVPLDAFLGLPALPRALLASLLVFSPVLCAGVVFASAFRGSRSPDRDLGANLGGAMAGGILEYAATLLGFRGILGVAMALYAGAALAADGPAAGESATSSPAPPPAS